MSNTTNTMLPVIEAEIRASNLAPQVRTWLLEMISSLATHQEQINALAAEVKELDEDGVDDEGRLGKIEARLTAVERQANGLERSLQNHGADHAAGHRADAEERDWFKTQIKVLTDEGDEIEARLAKLEGELEGAGDGVAGLTATLEAMAQDLAAKLAPVQQVEPAVQKLHAHVANLEWLQGARANLDKIVAFLWPLIGEATPPLDGAQIATRAMLDQQLATLSRALHDTINRVRRDVGDRLDELEDDIVAAGDPRAMLRRLFRRGK